MPDMKTEDCTSLLSTMIEEHRFDLQAHLKRHLAAPMFLKIETAN